MTAHILRQARLIILALVLSLAGCEIRGEIANITSNRVELTVYSGGGGWFVARSVDLEYGYVCYSIGDGIDCQPIIRSAP